MTRSRLYTVRKRMSMLFQSGALFTDLNVFDNVAYPLREHTHLPPALLHTTVMMKLEAVGLRGAAKLMPSELSGGMARRAATASHCHGAGSDYVRRTVRRAGSHHYGRAGEADF